MSWCKLQSTGYHIIMARIIEDMHTFNLGETCIKVVTVEFHVISFITLYTLYGWWYMETVKRPILMEL